jgi:hypothetical protein
MEAAFYSSSLLCNTRFGVAARLHFDLIFYSVRLTPSTGKQSYKSNMQATLIILQCNCERKLKYKLYTNLHVNLTNIDVL